MVQVNEKNSTVSLYVGIVFIITRDDFNHGFSAGTEQLSKINHISQHGFVSYHIPYP